MRPIMKSIEGEFRRYKTIAEAAMIQVADDELSGIEVAGGNSVAVVAWHIGGNLTSRFTDFLASDGEKPWRDREKEFALETRSREELSAHWEKGWGALLESLSSLNDDQLGTNVTIRGTSLKIHEALHRSLAHTSYHVGQIVFLAKAVCGDEWEYLSIPPGELEAYNQNPTSERADSHSSRLNDSK